MVSSGRPRFIVRLTNRRAIVQIALAETTGDKVLAAADSFELGQYGWKASGKSTPAAYLTGLLAGKRAKQAGVTAAILDMGLRTKSKGSRVFAALKGAVDAGLNIPHENKILPEDKRISGEHVAEFAKKLQPSSEAYRKQFSAYFSRKVKPEEVPEMFAAVVKALEAKSVQRK
jgi:large subunit ribosomal protein L18